MSTKPTMDEKYEALPSKGRAIVDAVIAAHTRAGAPAMQAEWDKQCKDNGVKLGESCALADIIRHKLKGRVSTGIHQ